MQEYAIKVKLTAIVRLRAADETVARRAATSVLLSIGAEDIRIANDNHAALTGDATITKVSFCVEGQPMLVAIGRSSRSKRAKGAAIKQR